MPIYEFACADCGHEFESFQRLSDPLPDTCPECGQHQVEKKISAAGFRLKGGGWYETDFKSGKKKNVTGDGGSSDSKSAGDGGKDSGSSSGSSSEGGSGSKEAAKSAGSEAKSSSKPSKKD